MKTTKYTGLFINSEGHEYTLEVDCLGQIQAFILLTAKAIKSGKHYQLNKITDEKGNTFLIDDITKVKELIKQS